MKQTVDEIYMSRAIELARLGRGHVSPNPAVGCVVVSRQGVIAGEGWHRRCGEGHAEVNALAAVHDKALLAGATIYVTLEPCSHFGKTPPCAVMLAALPIARVVVGSVDPNPKVSGRGLEILRQAGIEVECGVMEKECRALNPAFLTAQVLHRPFITLKWACGATGFMGDSSGVRIRYSNAVGEMWMHRERAWHDAVMVGRRTAIADNPTLTVRHWPGGQPIPIVAGGNGEPIPELALSSNRQTLWLPHTQTLSVAVQQLYEEHHITSLLVEGGSELLNAFLQEGLWDKLRRETNPQQGAGNIPAPPVPAFAVAEECVDICGNKLEIWHR